MTTASVAVMLSGAISLLGLLPRPTVAQMGMPTDFEERATQTASYTVKIRTGPKVTMPSPTMTVTDQGKPINHHIEVHIFNKGTGAEVKDLIPTVRVADQATGTSRVLTNITACRISKHRETEPHFGDNVYLPDGKYTITVIVGQETANFKDVVLKASK